MIREVYEDPRILAEVLDGGMIPLIVAVMVVLPSSGDNPLDFPLHFTVYQSRGWEPRGTAPPTTRCKL